jgi:hypothetical protein
VKIIASTLFAIGLLWGAGRCYYAIAFNVDCGEHIKRAADANTVDLAIQELKVVITYLDENKMTSGYTSTFYNSPLEDVGYWYTNLNASLGELRKVTPDTPQLVRSNLLLKLRETLLDHTGSGESATMPSGISIFPSNVEFALWGWVSGVLAIIGFVLWNKSDY